MSKAAKKTKEQLGKLYLTFLKASIFEPRPIIKDTKVLQSIQDLATGSEYKALPGCVGRTGAWMLADPLKNLPEAKEYIVKHVYPFNEPIGAAWMLWYGEGHYAGLHQDYNARFAENDDSGKLWYITSILISNKGMEGGKFIIAGDSCLNNKELASRLMVLDITEPGWGTCWNMFTLHGVSHITAGERITLMIAKRHPKHLKSDLEKKQN